MSINSRHLHLLYDLVRSETPLPLQTLADQEACTASTIRREVQELNASIGGGPWLVVKNGMASCRLGYDLYLEFIGSLSVSEYVPDQRDRLRVALVEAVCQGCVNLSELYRSLNLSESTKKLDTREMRRRLADRGLQLTVLPRHGVALAGNELRIRICTVNALMHLIDLASDGRLYPRKANSPYDNRALEPFFSAIVQLPATEVHTYASRIEPADKKLSYASKKYYLIYLLLSAARRMRGFTIAQGIAGVIGERMDVDESQAEGLLFAALDFTPASIAIQDKEMMGCVDEFLDAASEKMHLELLDRASCLADVYAYVCKQRIRAEWKMVLPDKMLKESGASELQACSVVRECRSLLEKCPGVSIDENAVVTLALILETWRLKSRVLGSRPARIAIVTNTSDSRILYFKEMLCSEYDVEVALVCDHTETDKIDSHGIDFVLVFSDRTRKSVIQLGYPVVKLHFIMGEKDMALLDGLGIQRRRGRLIASKAADCLVGLDPNAVASALRQCYPGCFV